MSESKKTEGLLLQEQRLIRQLNNMDDELEQLDYLLACAGEMPQMPEEKKTDENLISGCQARVWVDVTVRKECVWLQMECGSQVIRGVLALFWKLLDGRSCREILEYQMHLIEDTDIRFLLSADRFHGMEKVISRIRERAAAGCGKIYAEQK